MKFRLSLATLCLVSSFVSCTSYVKKDPTTPETPTVDAPKVEVPTTPETPTTPEVSNKPAVTVTKCTNCSDVEWKRIQDATVKANEVVAGACFKDFMLERKLIDKDGMTNAQVVEKLLNGALVVESEMYYTYKRVLGYTYPDVNKFWVNRKYALSWGVCDLASLVAHEVVGHKNGFGHDYNYSDARNYSVPYSINFAFDKCCK